jgi:oxygen-independent coproporphyrinogen-3 oxidase
MTTSATLNPPLPPDQETTAGNYFISNYPPFSFWTPEAVPEAMQVLDRAPSPGIPLGLYIHIPFCRKRCHFCYFKVYTDKNSAEIKAYNHAVSRELSLYAGKPFMGGRTPNFVYFGGGTPSYLSAQQLLTLTSELKDLLPWDRAEEVTFECEPGTLTESKLLAIREMGVTRLSLGVENFDDHILEINGRAHRSAEIRRTYACARSLGFPQINIDLIAGMVEETGENWRRCIDQTLELQPDSVTIYQMEVPYNTTIYKQMKAEGKLAAPVAGWDIKRRWVREAFEELERDGYEVGSAYTAFKKSSNAGFRYRDELWRGADLLSLGVASFSHIQGVHFQNEKEFGTYLAQIEGGRLPIHRACHLSCEERLIREMILQFKLGRLNPGYFRAKFDVDILTRFARQFRDLEEMGALEMGQEEVQLARDWHLRVDSLLERFFLPHHQHARYT